MDQTLCDINRRDISSSQSVDLFRSFSQKSEIFVFNNKWNVKQIFDIIRVDFRRDKILIVYIRFDIPKANNTNSRRELCGQAFNWIWNDFIAIKSYYQKANGKSKTIFEHLIRTKQLFCHLIKKSTNIWGLDSIFELWKTLS